MIRRILPALALALLLAPFGARRLQSQGNNVLINPGFENGYYHDNGVPELAVPNGWQLHYLDGQGFPGVADGYVARRPETVVWYIENAPSSERSLFFLDGNYTLKIFKPWAPLYAALSQEVTGLEVGAQYELVANVFVDVVETYSSTGKIPPSNEPEGVMLRTGYSPLGAEWRNEQAIHYSGWTTAGNTNPFHQKFITLRQTFTADKKKMTVWVEMVSKYAYVNNGFFLDRMALYGPGNSPPVVNPTAVPPSQTPVQQVQASPVPATAVPPTAVPPTAVPPTPAPPAPTSMRYTVQRGDTLGTIARRFGVTVAQVALANRIANYNFIYTGQVLTIPVAGAPAAPAAQPTIPPASAPQTGAPTAAPPVTTTGNTYAVQRGDSLGSIAYRFGVSVAALANANRLSNINSIYVGQLLVIPGGAGGAASGGTGGVARTYTVQRGDTLARIAANYGVTVAALQNANNLRNINFIYSGQVLRIP